MIARLIHLVYLLVYLVSLLIPYWMLIFCFSIVFCLMDQWVPLPRIFWARGHIKVRLSSLTLPWRRWRSRHHLTPVLRMLGHNWHSFVQGRCPISRVLQASLWFYHVVSQLQTMSWPFNASGPGLQELAGIHDVAVRNGFVRKVFSILTVQLLITTVIAGGQLGKERCCDFKHCT